MAKIKNFNFEGLASGDIGNKLDRISKGETFLQIPYEKIIRNPDNRLADTNIEQLAASIEAVGLLDPLRVKETDDGKYMLIAGERRWRAIGLIREGNPGRFSLVPAMVEGGSKSELEMALALFESNESREALTPAERRKNVALIMQLYNARKEAGEEIPEPVSKIIAERTGVTQRQAQKMTLINKSLIPGLVEYFDNKALSIDTASTIAGLDGIFQEEILKILKEGEKFGKDDVKIYKEEDRKLKTENQELKKELDYTRKVYNEVLQEIASKETGGLKEKEDQLDRIEKIKKEREERINGLTQGIIPKRRVPISDRYSPSIELDKAINRLNKAQYSLKSVLDNGASIDELARYKLEVIISSLNLLLEQDG